MTFLLSEYFLFFIVLLPVDKEIKTFELFSDSFTCNQNQAHWRMFGSLDTKKKHDCFFGSRKIFLVPPTVLSLEEILEDGHGQKMLRYSNSGSLQKWKTAARTYDIPK